MAVGRNQFASCACSSPWDFVPGLRRMRSCRGLPFGTGSGNDVARGSWHFCRVGLAPDTADLFPADLSGGMQKRVGLARALAGKPDILVLDNPTAGLDPILSTGIETLIREITEEQGETLIVVTADMERLTERYDDIAVLYDGVVQWAGPASRAEADAHPGLMQMLRGSREGPIRMRVRT